jgi:hypothetical protein
MPQPQCLVADGNAIRTDRIPLAPGGTASSNFTLRLSHTPVKHSRAGHGARDIRRQDAAYTERGGPEGPPPESRHASLPQAASPLTR